MRGRGGGSGTRGMTSCGKGNDVTGGEGIRILPFN